MSMLKNRLFYTTKPAGYVTALIANNKTPMDFARIPVTFSRIRFMTKP